MLPSLTSLRSRFTTDWKMVDLRRTALLILLILAVFSALWQYLMPQIRTIETNIFKRVPEIRKVVDVQRVLVPCPERGLVVLDKAQVVKKLGLDDEPGWLHQDGAELAPQTGRSDGEAGEPFDDRHLTSSLEILATGEIPETANGAEAISVIDMNTGVTTISVREKPAPWFQFRNDGAIGVRYGVDQRLRYVGNVYGRWDFLRVKDVYFSANTDLETGGDAKLQVGGEYRW